MVTTRDAGGPLEVVSDRADRAGLRARACGCGRGPREARFEPRRGAGVGEPGKKLAEQASSWDAVDRPALGRMKVAYYSPLPPERTGIADYSALLLPELQRRLDVEVVRRGRRRAPRGADVSLYHIGNNPDAHGWIVAALRRRRGVVVLHDFVLHHLIAGLTVGRGDGTATSTRCSAIRACSGG